MATSITNNDQEKWRFDVFLSFRGGDTRQGFIGHLRAAMESAGINVFIDNQLVRGENITDALVEAIQGSRIAVVVFSKHYGDSRWCLDELVKIMECKRELGQRVLPIFFDVEPTDVRKQTGSFGEAFLQKHKDAVKLPIWKRTLTDAANLAGDELKVTANGHEEKFIRIIIKTIDEQLHKNEMPIATYPVGINSRLQDVSQLLGVGANDGVRMIGIWGMHGIGKTTIAKAIYNKFYYTFEGRVAFLDDVMEKKPIDLQNLLLSSILKGTKIEAKNVSEGINFIKRRLASLRVLIIIDNLLENNDRVEALALEQMKFAPGSRIIITTTDQHLLDRLEVYATYQPKQMNKKEDFELFSRYTFNNQRPTDDEKLEVARRVVDYCEGLPLALQVLGSFLAERNNIKDWESTVDKLKKTSHSGIHDKLKISYDGLNDDKERSMFLDICCFFIGMDKDYVVQILDGCGFFAEIGLKILMERCLVIVNKENKLMMHSLVRDMGRKIVHEQFPGDRTRLWDPEDAAHVLTRNTGTCKIEGLALLKPSNEKKQVDITKAFNKMERLRLLQLEHINIKPTSTGVLDSGDKTQLLSQSDKLSWLYWHGFPLEFISDDFDQPNIVVIDLRYSMKLLQLWKNSGPLLKLRILKLSHCHELRQLPADFSKLPNLEKLILKDCKNLAEVDGSIKHLKRLVVLNLKDCKMLKKLPESFYSLKSVETLILDGCSLFEELSEGLGNMSSLKTLRADDTAIRQVPSTIVELNKLSILSICRVRTSTIVELIKLCFSLIKLNFLSIFGVRRSPSNSKVPLLLPSVKGLVSLSELSLYDCNLTDDDVPKDLHTLSSLEILDLGGNSFRTLPSLSGFPKLQFLHLNRCSNLHTIPDLPLSLRVLSAYKCRSLKKWPEFANWISWRLENCDSLIDIPRFDISPKGKWVHSAVWGSVLPRKNIPDWFTFTADGPSLSFKVPQAQRAGSSFIGLAVCMVYSFRPGMLQYEISVRNRTKGTSYSWTNIRILEPTWEDHLWLGFLPSDLYYLKAGDQVEVFVHFGSHIIKKIGAVMKEEMKKEKVDRPMRNWERERSDNSEESEAERTYKFQAWNEYAKELGVPSIEDEAFFEELYVINNEERKTYFAKQVKMAELEREKYFLKAIEEYNAHYSQTLEELLRDGTFMSERARAQVAELDLGAKNDITKKEAENNVQDLPGMLVKLMPLSLKLLYRYGDCMMSREDDDENTVEIIDMDAAAAAEYLFAAANPASMGQDGISQFIGTMEASATLVIALMRLLYAKLKSKIREDKVAFVEPSSMTVGMGNSNLKTQVLVTRFLEESPDSFFVVLHNSGYHWTLTVINQVDQIYLFIDPLQLHMGEEEWKDVLNKAIWQYNAKSGKPFQNVPIWTRYEGESMKPLDKLKILKLSHCHELRQLPADISKLPNLEILILEDCKNLAVIDGSIKHLKRLVVVNLKDCKMLKKLPESFYSLKSVETLILDGCTLFEELSEGLGNMSSLIVLQADKTAIRQVPSTIVALNKLSVLAICRVRRSPSNSTVPLLPPSFKGLVSVSILFLSYNNLTDDDVPKDLHTLSSLEILELGGNSFRNLPSFSGFPKLKFLYLNCCSNLHTIPDLPLSLMMLSAYKCRSLKKWPEVANWISWRLENCDSLIDIPRFDMSPKGKWVHSAVWGSVLPRKNIPDWFTFTADGPSLSFKVPQAQRAGSSFIGLAVCMVYSFRPGMLQYEISVRNRTKGTSYSWTNIRILEPTWEDHLWLGFLPSDLYYLKAGDQVEVFVHFGSHIIKKIGAVMKEEMEKEKVDRPMLYWEGEHSDNPEESEAEKADKIQAWEDCMKELGVSSLEDEAVDENMKMVQNTYLAKRINERNEHMEKAAQVLVYRLSTWYSRCQLGGLADVEDS